MLTVEWAFDRYSFGRPLASYQALKHRFADMKLWLESAQAITVDATRAVQDGAPDAGEVVREERGGRRAAACAFRSHRSARNRSR